MYLSVWAVLLELAGIGDRKEVHFLHFRMENIYKWHLQYAIILLEKCLFHFL